MNLFLIVCALLITNTAAFLNMGKMASKASNILSQSAVPGRFVRECSCQEQSICVNEMKQQAHQCSSQCFGVFQQITSNPMALRPCVDRLRPTIDAFISCVERNMRSCVPGRNGPRVQYHDIRRMFQLGEQGMRRDRNKMLNSGMVRRIRPIAETSLNFGGCVKNCFVGRNSRGFCFDRYRCQPNATSNSLSSSLRTCSRGLNWKTHAGQLCTCAQSAGVRGLQNFCSLMRVMG